MRRVGLEACSLMAWFHQGLKVGTLSRKDFLVRVRELAADDAVLTGLVEALLLVIEPGRPPRHGEGACCARVEPGPSGADLTIFAVATVLCPARRACRHP